MLKIPVNQKKVTIGMPEMISRVGARAVSGFSPTDITGLQLWLDFSDITTLFQDSAKTIPVGSDGDVIGAVSDKSGQNNDAIQDTTSKKPLYKTGIQNGFSVGRFDGADDYLDLGDILNITILTVLFAANPRNRGRLLSRRKVPAETVFDLYNFSQKYIAYDGNTAHSTINNYPYGTFTQSLYLLDGMLSAFYINSAAENTFTWASSLRSSINANIGAWNNGALNLLDGDIGEIIVYDSALSNENRQLLESYSNSKWVIY